MTETENCKKYNEKLAFERDDMLKKIRVTYGSKSLTLFRQNDVCVMTLRHCL